MTDNEYKNKQCTMYDV